GERNSAARRPLPPDAGQQGDADSRTGRAAPRRRRLEVAVLDGRWPRRPPDYPGAVRRPRGAAPRPDWLTGQRGDSHAVLDLLGRRALEAANDEVTPQRLAERCAQGTSTPAVDDADERRARPEGVVEIALERDERFLRALTTQSELAGDVRPHLRQLHL